MRTLCFSVLGILALTAPALATSTPAAAPAPTPAATPTPAAQPTPTPVTPPCQGRFCGIKQVQYIVEAPTTAWKECDLNYKQTVNAVEDILDNGGVPARSVMKKNADNAPADPSEKYKFTLYLNSTVVSGTTCSANISLELYVQGVFALLNNNPYSGNFILWRQNIVMHGTSKHFHTEYEGAVKDLVNLFVNEWQKNGGITRH